MQTIYMDRYVLPPTEEKHRIEREGGLSLLREGLLAEYKIEISMEALSKKLQKNPHGKPCLPDLPGVFFNISHSKGLAVCVIGDRENGIDVEKIREPNPRIFQKIFTKKERGFLEGIIAAPESHPECQSHRESWEIQQYREYFCRLWTLKESYLKWRGTGFSLKPTEVEFTFQGDASKTMILCSDPSPSFFQRKIEGGYILSLCAKDLEKEEIRWRVREGKKAEFKK